MAAAERSSDTVFIPNGLSMMAMTLCLRALAWNLGEHPLRESLSSLCLMALAVMEMYSAGSLRASRQL